MKKIFGIVLALALVLSMSVIAAPVSAAHDIEVAITNPLVGGVGDYVINFTMMQPLDDTIGEYIDVTFPTTTDPSTFTSVVVNGTDSLNVKRTYTDVAAAGLVVTQLGNTLRLTLNGGGPGNSDLIAGDVDVVIYGVTHPTEQCEHTLWVGTSQETAAESPEYNIFAYRIDLLKGWNLISLPVIPEDPAITVVLADLIARADEACMPPFTFKVYYYDCTTWYAYNNGSYASLTEMTECHAYWINVSAAISFYVKGEYYPAPPGPPLKKCYHECWNMVGFTSDVERDPFTVTGLCSGLSPYFAALSPANTVIYILGWDGAAQDWFAVVQGTNCLVPGMGYWVSFSADACFAVPPPGV